MGRDYWELTRLLLSAAPQGLVGSQTPQHTRPLNQPIGRAEKQDGHTPGSFGPGEPALEGVKRDLLQASSLSAQKISVTSRPRSGWFPEGS